MAYTATNITDTSEDLSLVDALSRAFDTEFTLWECQQGRWVAASDLVANAIKASSMEHAFGTNGNANKPYTLSVDELIYLVIPLSRVAPFVAATAHIEHGQENLAVRLAEMTIRAEANRQQFERLQRETELFVVQVSKDFEELTFLRELADCLRLNDKDGNLDQLIRSTLELLIPIVDCETLAIVRKERSGNQSIHWQGNAIVTNEQCFELLSHYGCEAMAGPFVKNEELRIDDLPGLKQLIIVPVGDQSASIGWILAMNKKPDSAGALAVDALGDEAVFGSAEATLLQSAASIVAAFANNLELLRDKERLLINVVRSLVAAIEAKDAYTCGHSERVALYGRCIAKSMGYSHEFCENIFLSGLLHDIGKIGVPDAALNKEAGLTAEEMQLVRQHPDAGWSILRDLDPLHYVLPGVLHHHERYDGRGYPDGLAGESIPIEGRILAIADSYDAMTSDRPYRSGMPLAKAEAILREGAGSQWDPHIIDVFFQSLDELTRIRKSYRPKATAERRDRTAIEP